jgi:hypothetical protein
MNAVSSLIAYPQPVEQPRSASYRLRVDGEDVDVLHAGKADFAVFECSGPVELEVSSIYSMEEATVKPSSLEISSKNEARSIRFSIEENCNLCLDVPGLKPLFIYANPPENGKPSPDDPLVHYYRAGEIYHVGKLELKSGETLYIEAGAVLRGNVLCSGAHDVKICGRGILDGSYYNLSRGEHVQSIIFENCRNVRVEDIIMIEPTSWMLVLACSRDLHVNGLKQIGSCMSSDGIDICGSQNVLIENCCLRNDDDNIAIKSVTSSRKNMWEGNVENVRVRNCTFLNGFPGNVMEIGYELRAGHVRDIVFEDIDVINAHGEGAVFSIHNGDRALVENVRWENIRVEHYWDKLVDFRVVLSRYNRDDKRGHIRNIHLKNIRIRHSQFNPGCSISLISGYRAEEPVENVLFEDFYLNDQKVLNPDHLELHSRHVKGLRFI